ncbi:sensor histidine kinase [Ktedonospora formicarum]|uniref:Histidine kinase n=1 Tax=Ktedonospora formicarum TaxID=2778364 RepID=A0A8J3I0F7_9CHLR|nr:sensor histidine kinase [Ktedonospora formicarum]GHO47672.1 histidine kinase [Ktedonospora formicarum]
MANMFFHLFTKKEGEATEQHGQQKRSLNWFLLLCLGFIYLQYVLPRLPSLSQGRDENASSLFFVEALSENNSNAIILALLVFTLLMALHSVLHWLALFKTSSTQKGRQHYLWFYFPLQAMCIWLIYLMIDGQDNVLSGLCFILAIEAMLLFKRMSLVIATATGCLLFCLTIQGIRMLGFPTQLSFPMEPKLIWGLTESSYLIPFVCASVMLYIQQTRAHQRDQHLLHELEATHRQLEDYATQVKELTLAAERQRMARELHDTLAQGLVGLTMQLETIDSLLTEQGYEQAQAIVRQTMSRSRATITSARAIITDLRTEPISTSDILEAIEAEAQHFTRSTGITCTCCLQAVLPGDYYTHLLRMVSEGLTNIARHSKASQAWIRSSIENGGITFDIEDDGIGFDPAQVMTGHYGLLGLRERARLMNGHLLINSEPGQGTTMRLYLPFQTQPVKSPMRLKYGD